MKRTLVVLACLLAVALPAAAADKRPMTVDDLFRFKRVSDPQISPDGKLVAYVVGAVDLPGNKIPTSLWLAPVEKGEPRQLTNAAGKKDSHPRWSPDGKQLLFESNRSGEGQLWLIDLAGGEARQLTTLSSGASNGVWAPDGKKVAFVSAVFPEFSEKPFAESDALNKKRQDEADKNPVKARTFTKLFYRHWNEWVEDKRQHLFVMPAGGGEPKDVTPGDRDAFPTSDTFSTGDNFTFSPDGSHLVFTAVPEKDEAWSTNYDLCRVSVSGGSAKWECLTKDNLAADTGPAFSPDGKQLAYRAQKKPGFEADRWQLLVVDVNADGSFKGNPKSITEQNTFSVGDFVWDPNKCCGSNDLGPGDQSFIETHDAEGKVVLNHMPSGGTPNGGGGVVIHRGSFSSVSISKDGKSIACLLARMNQPPEVFTSEPGRSFDLVPVSRANDALLAQLDLPRPESVTVGGAGGTPMQMWVLKPPGFDPKKKWPLAFLVHGGPQGAWEDGWSARWNAEAWAAQGYVVALPNPRGSTGFGQKYIDEISGDWGGKCYDDLMAGLAWMEKQDYIDKERMAAAGASFGGYMINWFEGHTDKFQCMVTHCGVYNFDSMYALTDELWFDEWEHGGPPWVKRESYEKYSPHRYAKNFKTPMLVVHNDLDFRVPVAEGYQLFTTLQRLGVPSKMVNFPDEGHWVLKPKNSEHWHKEVFAWVKKYAPPGGR